jgi:AcrR family transcriptional regulator
VSAMPTDQQAVPSVWTRNLPKRRAQDALSRDQIVSAAIALLDADGVEALSMRKLGAKLGAGATSLYWHVANKDQLMELVVDEAFGELDLPDPGGPDGWRSAATAAATSVRAVMTRHPWLAGALGEVGLAYLGPNLMVGMDRFLAIFVTAGLELVEAGRAVETLIAYVIGVASGESAWQTTVARSGIDEQALLENLWPAAEQAAQAYPLLRDMYAATRGMDPADDRRDSFTYGLDRVLDGLATRLHG